MGAYWCLQTSCCGGGFQITLPVRPVDLALTPDGRFLLVKNKADIDLIRLSDRTILQTLPFNKSGASFTGLCISPDGRHIYVTDADNRICIAGLDENNIMRWEDPIVLPAPSIGGSPFPGGLVLNNSGDRIYVTLSRNNSLAIVNLSGKSIVEIPVGIAPYEVLIASDTKAYVSNWGGRRPAEGEPVYQSSGTNVLVDPKTGVANSGAVSVVDLTRNEQVKILKPDCIHAAWY
jgi:YVTN family beta-propeller protein